jgi:purine-binding chemotaxis protein CheW
MVDLVKIRKKAKKQKEDEAAAADAGTPASAELSSVEAAADSESPAPAEDSAPAAPARDPDGIGRPMKSGAASPSPLPILGTPAPAAVSKLDRFREEAGRRRDQMVVGGDSVAAVEAGTLLELLTFVIANEHYAVDIERIMEIVTPRSLTRIPNADESIVGIMSLRGTIVTLVDVRRRLGHPPVTGTTADSRIVVVDLFGEMLGFRVDRVLRVIKTAESSVEPHPIVHASEQHEAIRGVFRVANALTILLDLDKLLESRASATSVA